MKRQLLTILTLAALLPVFAAADKTAESLLRITTYDAKGQAIGSAVGFAIEKDGSVEVLSTYTIFRSALKAVAKDFKSKPYAVHRITGANDLYDVVRFTLEGASLQPLTLGKQKPEVGAKVFVPTPGNKKQPLRPLQISEASEHGGVSYYTLAIKSDSALVGMPLLNGQGEVVAVIQRSASAETDKMFAIGIEFDEALEINTMSAADPSLASILMPKRLPQDEKQASSYLYLLTKNSQDTTSYLVGLGDYIEAYPASSFGYTQRAAYYVATSQFAKAEADYTQGLDKADDKADVHYSMSDALYHLNQRTSYSLYKDWDLERALSESLEAYTIFNSPIYLLQKGKCLYALKRYMEAHDTYKEVNATNFRSSENLYYQARSLQMAGGDSLKVLALLDSTVNRFRRPYREDAAPYVYYRAQQYDRYGFYREASIGYIDYEEIVGKKNLNDRFYYLKEQAEIKANFYPQALSDIEKAIQINPNEYLYYLEKALIEVRTQQYDEAIVSARQAQKLAPQDPDPYKLMGIAQAELGQKAEARKNLQRAIELGDEEAADWLKNMKK